VQARTLDSWFGLDLPFGGDLAHPVISLGRIIVLATRIFWHAQPAGFKPLRIEIASRVQDDRRGTRAARFLRRERNACRCISP
jgi:hypothetical protein